jgi:hypothetical protein
MEIIAECRFGIHDISRTGPRLNMPFELGLDIGCATYGNDKHRQKSRLILDTVKYRYQRFISDLNGHDPSIYDGTKHGIIKEIREWMQPHVPIMPKGGNEIYKEYLAFCKAEPRLRREHKLDPGSKFSFNDYSFLIRTWLQENA